MKLLFNILILVGCCFFITTVESLVPIKTSVVKTTANEDLNTTFLGLKKNVLNGYYENPFDVTSCSSGEVNVTISGIEEGMNFLSK